MTTSFICWLASERLKEDLNFDQKKNLQQQGAFLIWFKLRNMNVNDMTVIAAAPLYVTNECLDRYPQNHHKPKPTSIHEYNTNILLRVYLYEYLFNIL